MINAVLIPVLAFVAGATIVLFTVGGIAVRAVIARREMHQALCAVIHQNKLLRGEMLAELSNPIPDTPVIWPEEIEL
jgi:hypothetical protein